MSGTVTLQRGPSPAGVSGWIGPIDQQKLDGQTQAGFAGAVFGWTINKTGAFKERFGRGTDGEISYRFLHFVRNIEWISDAYPTQPPEPSGWLGQIKPVVLQMAKDRTITLQVSVKRIGVRPQKDKALWEVFGGGDVVGEPVYSGDWGDQVAGGSVTKFDSNEYEGSTLTLDPATVALIDSGKTIIDFWGLTGDTDAYVRQRLLDAVAAASAPSANLKADITSVGQDSPDGGTISITWSLTDSNDRAELPTRIVKTDANAVENAAQEGILYATGDAVPTISDLTITPPTDTKLATTTIKELNDGARMAVLDLQLNTPKEFITRRQSRNTQEAAHIENGSIVVEFTTSATSDPSGKNPDATNLEYDKSMSFRWSDTQYLHTHEFNPLSPKHRIEEDAYRNDTDPGAIPLVDEQARCVEDGTAGNGTPPTISGLVPIRAYTKKRGITAFAHYYFYSFRSNADKMIAGRTRVGTDPSGLASNSVSGEIYTGSAPGLPTLSNFELFDYEDLPTPNPSYTLRIYIWQLLTRAQEIEHRGTHTGGDIFGSRAVSGVQEEQAILDTCASGTSTDTLYGTLVTSLNADSILAWDSADVIRENKTHYRKIIRRPRDDKRRRIVSGSTREEHYSVDSAGTHVRIIASDPKADANGKYPYVLGTFCYWVTRETIVLRRYYRDDHIGDVDQASLLGTRHSDSSSFLGRAQYKIMYDHCETEVNWAEEGGLRWMGVDFFFLTSSVGFYESNRIPVGVVLKDDSFLTSGTDPLVTTPQINSSQTLPSAPTTTPSNGGNFNTAFLS